MSPLPLGTKVRYHALACSLKREINQEWERCPHCTDGIQAGRKCLACEGRGVVLGKPIYLQRGLIDRRDKHFAAKTGSGYTGDRMPPLRTRNGQEYEMDRWVVSWPAEGAGFVVGLVYRQEGYWDTYRTNYSYDEPPEYQNALALVQNHALYEIKQHLRSRPVLVPVEAVEVL